MTTTNASWTRPARRRAIEWVFYAAAVLSVGAVAAYTLWRERLSIEALESDRLSVQARVVSSNLLQHFAGIDNALVGVREDFFSGNANKGVPVPKSRRLKALTDAVPGLKVMLVLDAQGRVVAAHDPAYVGRDFSQRHDFTMPRSRPDPDVLYISRPFKAINGVWAIGFTRVLTDANGQFNGVVTASLSQDYFNVILNSVLSTDDMRSTLVHGDGIVFMNAPLNPKTLGIDLNAPDTFFSRHRMSGRTDTLMSGHVRAIGEDRLMATRTIVQPGLNVQPPLVVHVSREIRAMYADWRFEALRLACVLAALMVGAALAIWVIQRRRLEFDALAAEAHREREVAARRIRTITDNLPAMVAYVDRERRFRFANPATQSILGVSHHELLGRQVSDMLSAEAYEQVRPHVEAVFRGEPQHFERHRVEGDQDLHLVLDYVPDVDADQQVQGFYVMATDISARKRAELQRAASEKLLRDISDSVPALIAYCDAEQRCQFINTPAIRLLKLDGTDVRRYTLREALGEASYAQHEPHIRTVLQGKRTSFESPSTHTGPDAYYLAHLVPDKQEDGTVRGFYLMTFDITRLKRAELERAASEKLMRAVADNLPIMISYIDAQERIRFLNATFEHWTGIDTCKAIGQSLIEVIGPELYGQRHDELRRSLAGERVEFELESVSLGVKRHLHNVYVPDVDEDGRVAGVYTLSTDTTALKEVERQLTALARFDSLTGLPNRHQFNEKLGEALARAQRRGDGLALMFLDIDHFKAINDTLGHAAGDAVLKEFAQRLQSSVRDTDCVARLAGDEFVVILEGLKGDAQCRPVAQKILTHVAGAFAFEGESLRLSTSIGIAFHAGGPVTPDELLDRADKALYEAKAGGRNTFRLADAFA